jgi:beta-N-acetylhexosaminidase
MKDDLVMGAINQGNVCAAVVEALNAGVDLLLVAFDGTQFYRIFTCATAASAEGKLDAAMLSDSEARLRTAFRGLTSRRGNYLANRLSSDRLVIVWVRKAGL